MATKGYIKYRSDYKYQLAFDYEIRISIIPRSDIKTEFIDLGNHGNMVLIKG